VGKENDDSFNGCNAKGGREENREEGPAPGVQQLEEGGVGVWHVWHSSWGGGPAAA
jgi:hypothetical protein